MLSGDGFTTTITEIENLLREIAENAITFPVK